MEDQFSNYRKSHNQNSQEKPATPARKHNNNFAPEKQAIVAKKRRGKVLSKLIPTRKHRKGYGLEKQAPIRKRKGRVLFKLAVVLIFLGLLASSGYLYLQLRDAKNNPNKSSQQQVNVLVEKVGKIIALPKDEQPTIATVQDKDKLKEQPFFVGAENGDKLLIYTKAQKAIIYRESTNSLINVGPITLDTQSSGTEKTE